MNRNSNCASCLVFNMNKVIKSNKNMKPTWLSEKDYVSEFIDKQQNTNIRRPDPYDTEMKLHLEDNFRNKKLLYWAAESSSSFLVKDAKKAYGNFKNSGIVKVKDNGDVLFKFRCPQVYSAIRKNEKNPHTFFKHLHFVVFDEKEKKWDDQIYTKIVICRYNYKKTMEFLNTGYYVLINALPCNYYAKDHIPNSYNLFYKQVKKMTTEELLEWFSDIIKIHYPLLHNLVTKKKIDLYEIPIITYCANHTCKASEYTLEELMKKGFVNVGEYSGGIKEYRKYNKHD